jgi:23S rRNA (guanosine2251-2'-O)-methyltransferase
MQIIYYECENQSCGLRFPELREGLVRERCPMCRGRVRISMTVDQPPNENPLPFVASNSPVMVGLLDNIRSGLNVGSIFRTADGIGLSRLCLCGITPTPDNTVVKKTALGAEKIVGWEHDNNGFAKVCQLKAAGYSLWGLEHTETADSLYAVGDKLPDQPLVLVIGNEVCGIDLNIIEQCDRIVAIPMEGKKRSYNVAIAFGIAASYLRYCQIFSQGSAKRLPKTRLIP